MTIEDVFRIMAYKYGFDHNVVSSMTFYQVAMYLEPEKSGRIVSMPMREYAAWRAKVIAEKSA